MSATGIAHPNIALIKYWGKRDVPLNLPAVGSISITLDTLQSRTTVSFKPGLSADRLCLNSEDTDPAKASRCLDRFRALAEIELFAEISSENNFPTAAGLASSAAGFAALSVAADRALGLGLDARHLSEVARLGSGSASRSLFPGFAEWHLGQAADGRDSVAEPLHDQDYWPLEVVIAVTSKKQKAISSTRGMDLSRETSVYYEPWVRSQEQDLAQARNAIATRDFSSLAQVSERSCLKMHALAMSSDPGLLYWNGATLGAIHLIRNLRQQGHGVFFTVDAGPQVKAVCLPESSAAVKQALESLPGISGIYQCGLGPGARAL